MNQEKHFIVDILFVLALFGVFTVSALMLVTIGSEVYRHTVDDMDNNYSSRISVAYITEKIRQNDTLVTATGVYSEKSIRLSTLGEEPALQMTQNIDGKDYCTYLYLHDGYLKELFTGLDSYIGPNMAAAGQNIMELASLDMEQVSDRLLSIQLTTPEGETHQIYISTHCTGQ